MRTRLVPAAVVTVLLAVGLLAGAGAAVASLPGADGPSHIAGGGATQAAGSAATHSVNYVSVDPQATDDGTVVVESVFIERSGWVVLHAPAGPGERLGEPLGTTRVRTVNRFRGDVTVPFDDGVWQNWSTGEVVAVLHGENGDGTYTSDDPPLAGFGTIVRDGATVARGEPALVTAEGDFPQRAEGPSVTLRRVRLPADGTLVLRNRTADGQIVGSRSLPAGAHRNVTVALNESFYEGRGTFTLRAELRGGGQTGPLVRVGNGTVATAFRVRPAAGGGAVVTTPVPTTTTAGTDSPTATDEAEATTVGDTTTGGQPGFGIGALCGAAVALALVIAGRRRVA